MGLNFLFRRHCRRAQGPVFGLVYVSRKAEPLFRVSNFIISGRLLAALLKSEKQALQANLDGRSTYLLIVPRRV